MSETLLLELYERVAALEKKTPNSNEQRIIALEEKVAALEKALADSVSAEKTGKNPPAERAVRNPPAERRGKYRYLSNYLLKSGKDVIELTFSQIEEILQAKLPPSARQNRTMWANTKTHSNALSWMNVGYYTADLDMENETVKFERVKVYP